MTEQLCANNCDVCPVSFLGAAGSAAVTATVSLLRAEGSFGSDVTRNDVLETAQMGLRVATEVARPEESAAQAVTDAVVTYAQGYCPNYSVNQ